MSFIKSIGWTIIAIVIICVSAKICAGAREVLIANFFGIGSITDSYVIATAIPYRWGMIISMVAYTSFIPIFNKYLIIDKENARLFFNTCFFILAAVLAAGVLLMLSCSSQWVRLSAPGISPSSNIFAAKLMQIMSATLILLTISSLIRAANSTNQHYIVSSSYDLSANIITVIMLVISVPVFGAYGLALSILFGAIGQLIFQWVFFLKNLRPKAFKIDFSHPGIREFLLSFIPLLTTVTIIEINFFIMRRIASTLPAGTISALNFAFTVTQLPVGIWDLIIITVVFPFMAGLVNQNRQGEVGKITGDMVRIILFALLPISVFIVILRVPIIEILFQRGAFDREATQKTASVLGYFSLSLFAWGIDYLFFRIYYLIKRINLYIGLLLARVGLNSILYISLVKLFGYKGIALAFSIALIAHIFLATIFLKRKLANFNLKGIVVSFLKSSAVSSVMGLCIYLAYYLLGCGLLCGGNVAGKAMDVAICGIMGLVIYFLCGKIIMTEELGLFKKVFRIKATELATFEIEG